MLDLAAGTGTSSEPFAAAGSFVVPCDFSVGMLQVGKRARSGLPFVAGDATRLPFADSAFDAVTISFGLRNVVDVESALTEMARVTRPGGRVCLIANTRSDDLSFVSIADRKEILRLPIGNGPKHITVARVPASVVAAVKER